MPEVLSRSGIPIVSDFAGGKGTPLVINEDTGRGYVLVGNEVTPIGGDFIRDVRDFSTIQAAIDDLPSRGGIVDLQNTTYSLTSTLVMRSRASVLLRGAAPSTQTSGTTVLQWNGIAGGTVILQDGSRDCVIENVNIVSGSANFGVGIDWDKISGTLTSTHNIYKHVTVIVPSAGIGWRVSNVADANHEDGVWDDCFMIGPSITPGSRGTSVGVQIKAINSFNNRWRKGGASGLQAIFDLPDNLPGKAGPAGAINVENLDGGYSDVVFRLGSSPRHPMTLENSSIEFADQLLSMTGQSSEEFHFTCTGNRIVPPSAETIPFIDVRCFGSINLMSNSFTDSQGANASFIISVNHNDPPGASIVAINNLFPNSTPFDTTKNVRVYAVSNQYMNGSTPTPMDDTIGTYNSGTAVNTNYLNPITTTSYLEGTELGADPAAPASNKGRLYFRDNGVGKTQLACRFPTGVVQVVATEP
jgi:hypothetical protein